ncbi:MAG: choice-of-anchor B family protein, partial [Pseudomonadota bacterium]
VLVHDELDESDVGLASTTVRVLSLTDLTNPSLVETWSGPTAAIDHNGFVRGNRYYMSTYASGLTILDITDPTALSQVGFFDTYPPNNAARFAGAWGAYPYLPSGNIAVSDINGGLYLLDDDTRDVAEGSLAFMAASYGTSEGQTASLSVRRSGGTSGAVSVGYKIVHVGTDSADTQLSTGRLTWANGASGTRTLQIAAVADSLAEPLEELQVRLVDPQGGATLGRASVASLFIADAGPSTELELDNDDVVVAERGVGLAVVTLHRRGSADGAASLSYAVNAGDATAGSDYTGPANGTLSWGDGDALPRSIVFEIADDAIGESDEFFEVQFSNPQGAALAGPSTATVTIQNGTGVNQAPNVSAGANQQRTAGTNVMLNGSATFDPDGDALTYAWTQESGPTVTLNSADTPTATFVAPTVSTATSLGFRLTATDTGNQSSSATTSVTVVPPAANAPGNNVGGGGGAGGPLLLALLGLAAVCRRAASRTCMQENTRQGLPR